ncbi:MAG: ATP synthase subunit I [Acidobacteria bacterium]|nr:ATP synthase subunit I [Acidobacteriota bacterium]
MTEMSLEDGNRIELRFQRNTYIVIIVALVTGLIWSGWRMALGVMLGGALSLFNKSWLQGSVRAILSSAVVMPSGRVPPWTASKLILRYFVIAIVIGGAVWTGHFHPLGIGIGFAAFAGGVMIEAGYQLYLFFKSNEDVTENSSKE